MNKSLIDLTLGVKKRGHDPLFKIWPGSVFFVFSLSFEADNPRFPTSRSFWFVTKNDGIFQYHYRYLDTELLHAFDMYLDMQCYTYCFIFCSQRGITFIRNWLQRYPLKWAQQSARAKRAVRSKRKRERCKRTSERRSEWPSTLRVDFVVILPNVHWVAS